MYTATLESFYDKFFLKSKDVGSVYSFENTVFFANPSFKERYGSFDINKRDQLSLTLSGFTPLHAEEGFKLSLAAKQETRSEGGFDFIAPFFPIDGLDLESLTNNPDPNYIREQAGIHYFGYVSGIADLLNCMDSYSKIDVTCISLGGKVLTDLITILRQRGDAKSERSLSSLKNITLINSPLTNNSITLDPQKHHIEEMPNIGLDDPRFIGVYPSDPRLKATLLSYLYAFIYAENRVLHSTAQPFYPSQAEIVYITTSVNSQLDISPGIDSIIDIRKILRRNNNSYQLSELNPVSNVDVFPMAARGVGVEGHFINTRSKERFKEMLIKVAGNN